MKLIVGLGNPGKKYEKTRHNIGFMVVEELGKKMGNVRGLRDARWKKEEKFSAEICRIEEETLLIKPQTFMNGSGQAVSKLMQFYKVLPSDLWVIHDDVDIAPGKLKIRFGGSGAGHHGVESIIENLGTDKFLRFRLGIGHPRERRDSEGYRDGGIKMDVETFVIREFDINEKTELKHLLKHTCQAIEVALKDGPEKAMSRFNR